MTQIMHNALRIHGQVRIIQTDAAHRILRDTGWQTNQITNGGAAGIVQWLTGTPNRGGASQAVPYPAYMELGNGSGTPAASDTNLFAPSTATYIAVSQAAPLASNPLIAQWVGVWGPQYGPYNATEIGLFARNGTLFAHLLATIDLSTTSTTSVQWQWTISV